MAEKKDQKTKKVYKKYTNSLKEALEIFDLKALIAWVKKYNKPMYESFSKAPEEVQMATMCRMIWNRTDMLNTEAHKKACKWLQEHDMKGRIW